jgi:hypothetical protein
MRTVQETRICESLLAHVVGPAPSLVERESRNTEETYAAQA